MPIYPSRGSARQSRGGAFEVAAIDDALYEKAGLLLCGQGLQLAVREWPVEDSALAATEAQPWCASGQGLDVEVRRLGLGGEVIFE